MGKVKEQADVKQRLIKMHISPDDHVRLRIAALVTDKAVSEYCRDVVMTNVREVTKEILIPGKSTKSRGTTE